MRNSDPPSREPSALSIKVGRWAQATATGWGVAALVALAGLVAAVVLRVGPAWLFR